jgi:hypothetical protein
LCTRGEQGRDRPLAVGAVAADEKVGAAERLPALRTEVIGSPYDSERGGLLELAEE